MHRLTITITAPNDLDRREALAAFATQLEDIAADMAALPPQDSAFGAFGEQGCKIHYRLEIDTPQEQRSALLPAR